MRHGLLWAVIALLPLACGRRAKGALRADDSTFAATMVELRRIAVDQTLDSATRASARATALQRRGLTPASFEAKARALAADPARAAKVWESVATPPVTPAAGGAPAVTEPGVAPSTGAPGRPARP